MVIMAMGIMKRPLSTLNAPDGGAKCAPHGKQKARPHTRATAAGRAPHTKPSPNREKGTPGERASAANAHTAEGRNTYEYTKETTERCRNTAIAMRPRRAGANAAPARGGRKFPRDNFYLYYVGGQLADSWRTVGGQLAGKF